MTHLTSKYRILSIFTSSHSCIWWTLAFFLSLYPFLSSHAAFWQKWGHTASADTITVVYIHSLSSDQPFYAKQNKAFEEALGQDVAQVRVVHKYLNCRFWGKEDEFRVCRTFCQDARDLHASMILCDGDQALYSMLHCDDPITDTLPFIYNGTCINGPWWTDEYPNVHGCQAPIHFREMLVRMQRLFPERKNFVILQDTRMLSRKAARQLEKEFEWFQQDHPDIQLVELDVEKMHFKKNYYALRASAPDNILIIPYWGEIFYPIFQEMPAPIVSFQAEAVRENIFGVYAPNRADIGTQLGHYVARAIQDGLHFSTPIPFDQLSYHWSVDYKQLKKYGLKNTDFPRDTYWKNKPLDPRLRFLLIGLVIILFVSLAVTLVLVIRRYRRAKDEKLISETRADAQKPLLVQRQHFADVLAHEHMAVISYNKLGQVLFLNDCAAELLQLTDTEKEQVSQEKTSLNLYDVCLLVRGHQLHLLERLTNQVSESNHSVNIPSFSYLRLKNTRDNVRVSGMVRYVIDNHTPSYILTIKPLTGEDLKEELASLSVDVHRIYSFVYDFVDNSYHFTGAQPTFMRNLHNPSAFTLEDLSPFIHPEDVAGVEAIVAHTLEEMQVGKTVTVSFRILNPKHEWSWFENRFRIVQMSDTDDSLVGIGICQSIDDKKERELQLMQARDKAKEADVLKTAFLANMSHEIRTPLNSIVGFSSLLNNMEDFTQEEISEYIYLINKNCDMLLNLIGDILELSKIESGSMEFQIDPHPLYGILEEVMKSQKINMTDGVDFSCQISPDVFVMPDVSVDPIRLRQVLHNLINNSKKFTESGCITLGCTYEQGNNEYTLYVEDTGIGMSEEQCAHVFQRFYKANSFSQGAGLGLSICQTIVQRMGGHISVTSAQGKGSRFEVRLPLVHIL